MSLVLSSKPQPPERENTPGGSSLIVLLERGLAYIEQGYCSECIAAFRQAREQLFPSQPDLVHALDTFLHLCEVYRHALLALQEASKHFTEVCAELQVHAVTFKAELLPIIQTLSSPHSFSTSASPTTVAALASSATPATSATSQSFLDESLFSDLTVTCFAHFEVRRSGEIVTLCSNRKGQAIFRYLVAQPGHRAPADTLMTILWPENEPEVARHKLQVAVSALRRSLNNEHTNETGDYIQCRNGVYQLTPIHSDVDEFLQLYHEGRQMHGSEVAARYEQACRIYTGPFLIEDMYADWSFSQRDYLGRVYLAMCNSLAEYYLETGRYEETIKWAGVILKENRCDEAAYQHIMRAYALQGRRTEAVRQYQRCERALREELAIAPSPETTQVLRAILA